MNFLFRRCVWWRNHGTQFMVLMAIWAVFFTMSLESWTANSSNWINVRSIWYLIVEYLPSPELTWAPPSLWVFPLVSSVAWWSWVWSLNCHHPVVSGVFPALQETRLRVSHLWSLLCCRLEYKVCECWPSVGHAGLNSVWGTLGRVLCGACWAKHCVGRAGLSIVWGTLGRELCGEHCVWGVLGWVRGGVCHSKAA